LAKGRDLRGEIVVRSGDCAGVAHRAEILGRIETEGGNVSDATDDDIAHFRAVRLRTILKDRDVAMPRLIEHAS
jgi:hypothetical protein